MDLMVKIFLQKENCEYGQSGCYVFYFGEKVINFTQIMKLLIFYLLNLMIIT
jgi:hypothetical protein